MQLLRFIFSNGLLLVCLAVVMPAAHAAERIALVIGNDSYEKLGKLNNAGNDARAMADKLKKLGFKLVDNRAHTDLSKSQFTVLIKKFGETLRKGDIAFFYFAGHGVGGDNTNYLIPVDDENIAYLEDVPDFAIDTQSVMRRMEQRGEGINLVILDACRDRGLPSRTRSGVSRGLSRMAAPSGSFIGYAASPGQRSFDGKGGNGVFTEQLISLLDRPGLSMDDIFGELTEAVEKATGRKQTPMRESNLRGRFLLVPANYAELASRPEVIKYEAELLSSSKANDSFRDCMGCPEMINIKEGFYMMGNDAGYGHKLFNLAMGSSQPKPVHQVRIPSFSIGKYEVTFEEWDMCVAEASCKYKSDAGWGRGRRPVINILWSDAQDYVRWLSRKTSKRYRLPSESEWEYAARASSSTAFSFGDCLTTEKANYDGDSIIYSNINGCGKTGVYLKKTSVVGSYPDNAWGLHDMHGNVWEWVQDCWNPNYNGAPVDGAPWEQSNNISGFSGCLSHVIRGGAWDSPPLMLMSSFRRMYIENSAVGSFNVSSLGFRVSVSD